MKLCTQHPPAKSRIARRAYLVIAGLAAFGSAIAQTTPTDETVEEIVVTGSRLATDGANTSSPVTVMTQQDLINTGETSIGEVLRHLPVTGAQTSTDTAGRGNSGIATVALRGLSPVNTLILMDGHRLVAADDQGRVDLNSVPFGAIERVEVLQDGASAIYGVDAIAGVVNLIMRDSYDGFSIDARYGISDRSDADVTEFGFTVGAEHDDSGFVLSASYRDQNGYLIADRPCCLDADQRGKGGANLRDPIPVVAAVVGLDPNDPTAEWILKDGVQQATTLDDFRPFSYPFTGPGPNDGFNWWGWETSMSDSTIANVYFAGHRPFGSNVQGYIQLSYNSRDSLGFLAPDGMGAIYGDEVIISANNDYNPFGVDLSVARQTNEQGLGTARQSDVNAHTTRALAGFRGEISAFGNSTWKWNVSADTQRLDDHTFRGHVITRKAMAEAAGDSDVCRAAGNGCVPVNLLGAQGTITQEMLDFLTVPTYTNKKASLDALQVDISGTLFTLPAGDVQLAVGAEYREEDFNLENDRYRNNGEIIFQGSTTDAHPPTRKVKEVYFETTVPVLNSFNVDFALRYSDFNQFGSTTNPKIGLRWRPLDEWLFRGSFGTAFRAPTFNEAYAGQSRGFRTTDDPCRGPDYASYPGCNGVQAPPTTGSFVIRGGNPNLDPETAETYTVGVVWTPRALDDLSIQLDAYSIHKDDVISSPDVNYLITQNAIDGSYSDLVFRDSQNRLDNVIAVLGNIGKQDIKGYDLGIDYTLPEFSFGTLVASVDVSYLDKFAISPAHGLPTQERAGKYATQLGTNARIRAVGSLQWLGQNWNAIYSNRYVDGVTNLDAIATDTQEVDSYLQHDLSVGYQFDAFGSPAKFTLGIQNISDEMPPFVEGNTSNGFDTGTFNSRGRYFYIRTSIDIM